METVSESFKKAIKSDVREIKGYVEVLYNTKEANNYILEQAPDRLKISLENEIIDGIRKTKNYASLEENYTLLDGSFILPNYNIVGDKSGYISNDVFSNIDSPTIKISSVSDYITTNGITIYFKDNIAQSFVMKFTLSDNTIKVIDVAHNTNNIYQQIFTEPLTIKTVQLDIIQMEFSNKRIRISEIDLGISQVYEGNDLVSFTTIEEIDLLLTSTPINECTVNLNNYDNLFNPINPTGIVKYLTEDCIVRPYIGVLTEENGIEYVGVGYYYLKDWSSDVDGNITLNSQNLINKLASLDLRSDGTLLKNENISINEMINKLYGYNISVSSSIRKFNFLKEFKLLDFLRNYSIYLHYNTNYRKIFFVSRNNVITLSNISFSPMEIIKRTELLENAKICMKNVIKKVNITTAMGTALVGKEENYKFINQDYTLTDNEMFVWFKFDKMYFEEDEVSLNYSSEDGATAELIDIGRYLAYIKLNGKIGDTITLTLTGTSYGNNNKQSTWEITNSFENPNSNSEEQLSVDISKYFYVSPRYIQNIANFFIDLDKKYQVSLNYIGDPSLLTGDTVSVETLYGNKNFVITKHQLTFDGKLQGYIEGVGD